MIRVVLLISLVASSAVAADPPKPDKNKFVKGPAIVQRPPRDPLPLVAAIDREWLRALEAAGVPASPEADDAEFLRRACLDLSGVVPTYQQAIAFLDDDAPDKRRRLIDELLAGRGYAQHFGRTWRRLIWPPDYTMAKSGVDRVTPWLADQFYAERPWNELVTDLLTVEASMTHDPRGAFFAANSDATTIQPNRLADATGRLFLGVQIGCAECHNHPFARWKQEDFWGLAACFSRVRKVSKSDASLTESPESPGGGLGEATITVADGSGKAAGTVVPARFLGVAAAPRFDRPLRPQLAEWITSQDNSYFARAMVNRLWAHLLGRGLVNPVDDLREENPPSHPELLDRLAAEFVASDFDVKHIVRAVCLSRAYGRTSRPLPENVADVNYFSHTAVKVMNPDVLYDALHTVINADPRVRPPMKGVKPTKPIGRGKPVEVEPRDAFVRFFSRAALGDDPLQYGYGVPQMLQLLNGVQWNGGAPFLEDLSTTPAERRAAIETIHVVALSRRPTDAEVAELLTLVGDSADPREAYAGVLWVLVNGAEFVVNR